MSIVVGYDAIRVNLPHVPAGRQVAGYTTGSGDVPWTAEDWAAHPGAVRICQDAGATDRTADVLDIERGAATIADAPGWYRDAVGHYQAGTRPGQRWPGMYTSQSNVTPLVNALIAGGVKSGPRLIVANWNLTEAQAEVPVLDASGPFPIAGLQFAALQFYDVDVWSEAWLSVVSKEKPRLVSVEMIARMSDGTSRSYTA